MKEPSAVLAGPPVAVDFYRRDVPRNILKAISWDWTLADSNAGEVDVSGPESVLSEYGPKTSNPKRRGGYDDLLAW